MTKNDIIMKVKLCETHKKLFKEKVALKLSNGEYGINPTELCELIRKSENCVECKWCTTFPSLGEQT